MRTLGWHRLAVTVFFFCLFVLPATAQEDSWQGSEKGPQLKAHLVDKEKNAARRIAVVDVDVRNVTLTDPISYPDSGSGMGHLQYRVDSGPYILPMANQLAFEGLTPGKHNIEVSLADGSFRPMGAQAELEIVIP
ncbi:MAG: hypothetical protein LAO18_17305 [Acidobacteriia bacterium]|nr:hypothetical protein [Terriglobia bacterium]